MIDFINARLNYVSWAVVVLVFAARVLTKTGPTNLEWLPEVFDVTTWKKYGRWGRLGQLLVNVVLSGGTVLLATKADGWTLAEWKLAGWAAIESIGIYHGIKLMVMKNPPSVDAVVAKVKQQADRATKTPVDGALIVATSCFMVACGLSNSQVSTVLDHGQAVCQNLLLRSDTPKVLVESGVLPEVVSEVIQTTCAALPVAEILAEADTRRAPRARALQGAARERGLL